MLCNMPSFLNKSGLIERQVLARREVPSGGKLGGKLFIFCPALWDTFTVYLPSILTKTITKTPTRYESVGCDDGRFISPKEYF